MILIVVAVRTRWMGKDADHNLILNLQMESNDDREYCASADDLVRLTIDYDIRAFDQRGTRKPNLDRPCMYSDAVVVEVKADAACGDRVAKEIGSLPLRVSRHSKYAVGVAAMLGA